MAMRPRRFRAASTLVVAVLLATPLSAQEHRSEPAPQLDTGAPPPVRLVVAPPPAGAAESLAGLLSRVLASDPQVRAADALLQASRERRLQARSRMGPSLLLINARIKPADIGFIRPGQDAHVRVLAYDPSTYGQLEGKVVRVGADAVAEEREEPYFEVQISAPRGQVTLHGQPLAITPGMPVDVGILTGRRSVAQYLLKPVLRSVQGALQER